MTIWRTLILFCSCGLFTNACSKAEPAKSAFFCQGILGPGRYSASAAVREIPSGDVQFAISKWQENGHHFGLSGIAKRSGERWVYFEPARGSGERSKRPCKITILWPRLDRLAMLVDDQIGCDDHHGRAFGWLSSLFTVADYNGAVRDEFDDDDYATFGLRCDEPGARHGPIRVVE